MRTFTATQTRMTAEQLTAAADEWLTFSGHAAAERYPTEASTSVDWVPVGGTDELDSLQRV